MKSKWLKPSYIIISVLLLFSISFIVPAMQEGWIYFGESLVQRTLNHEVWKVRFFIFAGMFILLSFCIVLIPSHAAALILVVPLIVWANIDTLEGVFLAVPQYDPIIKSLEKLREKVENNTSIDIIYTDDHGHFFRTQYVFAPVFITAKNNIEDLDSYNVILTHDIDAPSSYSMVLVSGNFVLYKKEKM